ncbi:hypothetical protein MKW94_005393, partial [Papaver nudicaule]|nr:hypothetical protein [Papaver nudicaule]
KYRPTLGINNNQTQNIKEEASDLPSDENPLIPKKTRISWAPELHSKFVEAFYKLGDQAVPSKIKLEMNVPGLTNVQIASHLQKYKKILKKQSQNSDNNTALNGTRGRPWNLSFLSLLNFHIQNGYLNGHKSHHPESTQLSHPGVTSNASNYSLVNSQPYFLPSNQQYTSQISSAFGIVNRKHQKIQVPDTTVQNMHSQSYASGFNAQNFASSSKLLDPHMMSSSMFQDYNASIDSRAGKFQIGEASNVLLFDDHASSSQLNTTFQDDYYTLKMTDSSLSGFDELTNVVTPTIPSTNVMESQRADQMPSAENPLAFLETDNEISYLLGSYNSADNDLNAVIGKYQQQYGSADL